MTVLKNPGVVLGDRLGVGVEETEAILVLEAVREGLGPRTGVTEGVPVLVGVGVLVAVMDRVELGEGVEDEVSVGVAV